MSGDETQATPAAPGRGHGPDALLATGHSETQSSRPGGRRLSLELSRFSGLYIWAGFILLFALWIPDTFLTSVTVRSIAGNQAITAILVLGVLFTLAAGRFDLSVAQNLGLSAAFAAWLMTTQNVDPVLAAGLTLVLGLVIGVINGVLVAYVGVDSFVATLGMMSVLLAFTQLVTDYEFVDVPASFQDLLAPAPLGIPLVTILMLGLAVVAWYALEHTPVGRRFQATGANEDAARLAGINTRRYLVASFIIAGVAGAFCGLLLAAKIGQISPSVGPPYLLPIYAACFLGTTQLKPGRFNVWGSILALYLLATGVTGLQLAGGQLWLTDLFNGMALIIAVSVAIVAERRRKAHAREGLVVNEATVAGGTPEGDVVLAGDRSRP
jgi:ribose transport system permease protein